MFLVKLFSALMLVGANLLEFFMQVNPCNLCWYQRFCWIAILLISVMYKYIYKYVYLIIIILLLGIGIAVYQMLLQYKIIIKSTVCKIDAIGISSATINDCAQMDFTIFYLPLSFYNAVASLFLLLYVCYYNYKK